MRILSKNSLVITLLVGSFIIASPIYADGIPIVQDVLDFVFPPRQGSADAEHERVITTHLSEDGKATKIVESTKQRQKLKQPENAVTSATQTMSLEDGTIGSSTGNQQEEDQTMSSLSSWTGIAGLSFVSIGVLGLLGASFLPFTLSTKTSLGLIVAGVGCWFLPVVLDRFGFLILIGIGGYALWEYIDFARRGRKEKKLSETNQEILERVSIANERRFVKKGDLVTAAAIRFVRTGDKNAAKVLKAEGGVV